MIYYYPLLPSIVNMFDPYYWYFNKVPVALRLVLGVSIFVIGLIFFICGCVYLHNGEISTGWAALMLIFSLSLGAIQIGAIVHICGCCR